MEKIIFCLLTFTLLLKNNLTESRLSMSRRSGYDSLATCTTGEDCILHNQCDDVVKITRKGYLTKHERIKLRRRLCKYYNHAYYLCCAKKDEIKSKLPEPPVCGLYFSDRIYTTSEDTYIDQYPWTALIMYSKPGNKIESHCGGSLITERHVLSAAHCETKVPKTWKILKVRLGEWNRRTNPDCMEFINEIVCNDPYVDAHVQKVIVHPNYKKDSINQLNDIALLELENSVKFTEFIKPICLPTDPTVSQMDFTSHSVEISGFKLSEKYESSSPMKKVFYLSVVSQDKCIEHYAGMKIDVSSSQICAGIDKSKEFCNADSGGSLMKEGIFPNSKFAHYKLIGIQSFGPENCATKENPGVYTLVSQYVNWVIGNIN